MLAELPFGNRVVTLQVNGAQIKAAIENGLSRLPMPSGGFPQVSGLTVEADASRPVDPHADGCSEIGSADRAGIEAEHLKGLGGPPRRSRASCAGMPRHVAGHWNIGPPPRNGMLIVRRAVPNRPSWWGIKRYTGTCRTGLQVRSLRLME